MRLTFLFSLVLTSVSCALQPARLPDHPSSHRLTHAQEEQLGRRFNTQIKDYVGFLKDPDAAVYLATLGGRLVKPLEPQPFKYRFNIIEDNDINAFAVPGGYIYVNTGLLTIIETSDELAAVLAHEIAHVNNHHASQSISKGSWLDIGTMAAILGSMFLVSDNPKAALGIMAGATGANLQAKYAFSRQQEREADKDGIRYLRKAEFDPRGIVSLFEKMKLATRLNPTSLPPYLLTHPLEEDRIRAVGLPPEDGARPKPAFDAGFEKFRIHLKVKYDSNASTALAAYEQEAEEKRDDPSMYRLAVAYFAAARYDESIAKFKALSEPFRAGARVERDLGRVYLEKGEVDEALVRFERAVKLDQVDYVSCYLLAQTLELKDRPDPAMEYYAKAATLDPLSADANYKLGVIYGKREQLGPAHYYLAKSFLANDDPDKAAQHFKKSITQYGEDSPDGKRVRREMRELIKE